MPKPLTLDTLRRYAVNRTLFAPTTLQNALTKIGFVQIDPISAPAPAHDLILRHRVQGYQKGDIERVYSQSQSSWALEEAFFINHGYVPRALASQLWASKPPSDYLSSRAAQVERIQNFAREHPEIHPKILNQHINSQTTRNNWGGQGMEGTQILQRMHSSGMLRIVRREKGFRVYGLPVHPAVDIAPSAIIVAAIQTLAQTYAPFTHASLTYMLRLLAQSRSDLKPHIATALQRAHELLAHAELDGQRWYWPQDETPFSQQDTNNAVRLLTPFDPLVWDRARFEKFWGWAYKFEAYKPVHERQFGYYALPLIWREVCIGWGNLSIVAGVLHAEIGYVAQPPTTKIYQQALNQELARFAAFAGCQSV